MQAPIVGQLQEACLDKKEKVSDLLRMAKLIAVKLNLPEIESWIENELDGYKNAKLLPDYRKLTGEPKARNPYHGWIPIIFDNADKIRSAICTMHISQSIGEIEHLLDGDGQLISRLSERAITIISRGSDMPPTDMVLFVGRSQLFSIVEKVRNKILDWALKLEKSGIHGENLTFSDKEKEIASSSNTIYHINHLVGNIVPGKISKSKIKFVNLDNSKLLEISDQIQDAFSHLNLSAENRKSVDESIDEIRQESKRDNPDKEKIKARLGTLNGIAEKVGTSVIATGIIETIKSIF